ncbi:MAG: cytochrome c oxidase assembly protein [Methylobacter sp.]|uniref:cytochrome c oxidase assembly protein n=1 Tax=Methylobacter sp. TaxID=2051955 RepID=UPI00258A0C7A|nr:cytochrome c oxidase assembly protein [Methylobacter sp.]MCL7421375.1 cytochrome c oxidase assembly protein [Methylobacter sp.]
MKGIPHSVRLPSLAALGVPVAAHAHGAAAIARDGLWTVWNTDLTVLAPLALTGGLYTVGLCRLRRRVRMGSGIRRREATAFAAGWLALFIALVSPLDALGNELFSAHMAQHEIMMLVAAPLLVLSRPVAAFLWGMPTCWRRRAVAAWRRRPLAGLWHFCRRPLSAWGIHALVLWLWHIPLLFQSAIGNNLVHTLQHLGFLLSALLFWWAMVDRQQGVSNRLLGVFYIFTTAVHTGILGALLTFTASPWYPDYAATAPDWGFTPIEDQQLGGLIMWVPGGAVFIAVGLLSLMRYFQEAERISRQNRDLILAKRE